MSETHSTLTTRPRFNSLQMPFTVSKPPRSPHNTTQYIMNTHKAKRKLTTAELELLEGSMMQAIKDLKPTQGCIWFKTN